MSRDYIEDPLDDIARTLRRIEEHLGARLSTQPSEPETPCDDPSCHARPLYRRSHPGPHSFDAPAPSEPGLDVETLARAILRAAHEDGRHSIDDGFEWYGPAADMAAAILASLRGGKDR